MSFKTGDKVKLKNEICAGDVVGDFEINGIMIESLEEYGTIVELDNDDKVHGVMEKGGDLTWGIPWYIHEDALEFLEE